MADTEAYKALPSTADRLQLFGPLPQIVVVHSLLKKFTWMLLQTSPSDIGSNPLTMHECAIRANEDPD